MKRQVYRLLAAAAVLLSLTLSISAVPDQLIPGGCTIGVKLQTQGPVIMGFDTASAAEAAGLQKGDMIVELDGHAIRTAAELREKLTQKPVILTVLRDGKEAAFSVCPRNRQIGAFVQDSVAGIGTVTYYDPNTGAFGALGHGVSQSESGELVPMEAGVAVHSSVVDVVKGESGAPGELKGKFRVEQILGQVSANSAHGIFGTMTTPIMGVPIPVADPGEIQPGSAEILSNVSGETVGRYDVEILKIYPHADATGRNLLLQVTDPDLLQTTGGIIRGMSGSPIIQNGKLVGAVTHVLVNDPTRGYGIFIENMLDAAGYRNGRGKMPLPCLRLSDH